MEDHVLLKAMCMHAWWPDSFLFENACTYVVVYPPIIRNIIGEVKVVSEKEFSTRSDHLKVF